MSDSRRSEKHIKIACFLLLMPFESALCQSGNMDYNNANIDNLYSLSLEELLSVNITGSAVRSLELMSYSVTGSAFGSTNLNTAATIEVFDAKTIEGRGLKNVAEVVGNVAGVTWGDSPAEPNSFSMRGFSGGSIKLLYDGISLGLSTLNMRPLTTNNLAKIEVIKGPSVLRYGQGAAGGTVNIIRKTPHLSGQHKGTALVSYGRYDTSIVSAEVTGPINDSAAYRFDFDHTSSNGWVDDTEPESSSMSGAVLWAASPSLSLTLSLAHDKDQLAAYWGTPFIPRNEAIEPVELASSNDGFVIDEKFRFNNYNVANNVIESTSLWTKATIDWLPNNNLKTKSTFYHFSADRDWRNAESYIYSAAVNQIERDRLLVTHDREVWGLLSELKTTVMIAEKKNYLDITLDYNNNDFSRQVGFNSDSFFVDFVDIQNPVAGQFGFVNIRDDIYNEVTTALAVENRTELTSKLFLDLGVRFENIDVERIRYDFDGLARPLTSINDSINQKSYQLALVNNVSDNLSVYLQYDFQHDTFSNDIPNTLTDGVSTIDPSDIEQYEVGLKGFLYNEKIQFTLSYYETEKEVDLIFADSVSKNMRSSQGVDFSTRLNVTDHFRIGGSISYTDAELDDFYDTSSGNDVSGNTPVNAPEWITDLWLSYDNVANLPIEIGGGVKHVSDLYSNNENTAKFDQYTLINIFTAYTYNQIRLSAHIRNLTDELYVPWADVNYPDQALLGAPRTYELRMRVNF